MKLTGISVLRGEGGGLYKPKAFTKEVWQYVSVILLDRVKRYLTFNLIHVNSGYKSVCEQRQNSCSGPPPVYQDLSTCHNWHVENPLVICQSQ